MGFSFGGRGLRVGRDAKGRNYRQISIPGTGIYRRDYLKRGPVITPSVARSPRSPSLKSRFSSLTSSQKYLLFLITAACVMWIAMLIIKAH